MDLRCVVVAKVQIGYASIHDLFCSEPCGRADLSGTSEIPHLAYLCIWGGCSRDQPYSVEPRGLTRFRNPPPRTWLEWEKQAVELKQGSSSFGTGLCIHAMRVRRKRGSVARLGLGLTAVSDGNGATRLGLKESGCSSSISGPLSPCRPSWGPC